MKYILQNILITLYISCIADTDKAESNTDANKYIVKYRSDSTIYSDFCQNDSFSYIAHYHRNGKISKERWDTDNFILLSIYNSWDTLGNPLVVNGNGYHYEYYDNGMIKMEGTIKNFLYDSVWRYYTENGEIDYIETYKQINHSTKMIQLKEFGTNGKLREEFEFNDDGVAGTHRVYDKHTGVLVAIGIFPNTNCRKNYDSLNNNFYSLGFIEVESYFYVDENGILQNTTVFTEGNPNIIFYKCWYNNKQVRIKILYDTLDKTLKYYEYYYNSKLHIIGNIRYFKIDEIATDCSIKFKEDKKSKITAFYGYLKSDIWKEYDELGNLCNEKNMNAEIYEQRKIYFNILDIDE